jgi:Flp pilus assembly protein TadG
MINFRRVAAKLRTCSAGAVAVLTAVMLPVLLGFTSAGVEVGHWYLVQREMQGAADAAAISAAAQYIVDFPTDPSGTTYRTVGQSYASLNGFTIPTSNVCLVTSSGDNCGSVRSLDSRAIICSTPPCVVVEITQDTASWFTTQKSLQPVAGHLGWVQSIPTPTLMARSIVSAKSTTITTTKDGPDCILALANDSQAILVHGTPADLKANCGISADGGLDQNVSGTPLGGITFSGNSKAHISSLVVASSSTGCPSSHCFLFNSTTPLPSSAVLTNTATLDPYASMTFPTIPLGVQTGGVVRTAAGSGYTSGLRTFTIVGGTGTPAKFTATVPSTGSSKGQVPTAITVTDPGAYTSFPTGTVAVTADDGTGSGATFTLTEGCFTWNNAPIAGRKYCSIQPTGTKNFPAGNYFIAGGDSVCVGFCISGNNHHVTSDVAGVTFYLTNGDGANSRGADTYAQVSFSGFGNNTTLSLCAPGTNCGTGCTGSCLLFVQGAPAAVLSAYPIPQSTSVTPAATTVNNFSGNGNSTLSGLVYLPKQTFQNQGNSQISGCFGVVAKYVDVGGTPTFTNGCLPGHGIGGGTTTVSTFSSPYLTQ